MIDKINSHEKILTTTLNKIKEHNPCVSGYKKALEHFQDTDLIHLTDILESNGVEDAIWCLRVWPEYDREWRLFAVWCARQVQHNMIDQRSVDALDVVERYANGLATSDDLSEARDAAWSAARDADAAAAAAARSAAWAAEVAARSAALAAAAAAARSAARSAQKIKLLEIIDKIEKGKEGVL